ncbi:phage integrase SAM-like domain-containing protein [Siphonobacter curvatus]|nr:phage integrase SAM-like domain-containing protein [Siphonobacter curvatus]
MDNRTLEIGSTGIKILSDHWNGKRVSQADPLAQFKNEKLLMFEMKLTAIFNDFFRLGKPFNVEHVKKTFRNPKRTYTFLEAFSRWHKEEIVENPNLTVSTAETYDKVRKKLIDFLISEKQVDLPLELFDVAMLKKYRRWMERTKKHKPSYIRKHSQVLKAVTKWAPGAGMAEEDLLVGFRVKNEALEDPLHLTPEMLEAVRTFQTDNVALQEVADVFFVYCKTGFHYQDLKDMARLAEFRVHLGIDDQEWITHPRVKTKVKAKLPVFDEVRPIIDKYGGWEKLPIKSNKTMNDWLKVLAAYLKFPEPLASKLSIKIGRKTFTDWALNELGLTKEAVAVMLGRKSTRGLEVYGKPDERRVALELGRLKPKEYKLVK